MANQSGSGKGRPSRPNPGAKRQTTTPAPGQAEFARRRERRASSVAGRKEERARRAARDKRNWMLTKIGIGVVVVALVAWIGWTAYSTFQTNQIKGDTEEYFSKDDFVAAHYDTGAVLYEQVPPTGGYHNAVWQNCGFYDQYINNVNGVHSLEHGAVWIAYDPAISDGDKETLRDIAEQSYILVSPYPGMEHPITLSIWGHQLKLDSFDKGKIDDFVSAYRNKQEYTPEFGGICYGGTSATTDVEPQTEPYVQSDPDADPIGGIRDIDATATAQAEAAAQNPPVTPAPSSPVASPMASPVASPEATPAASPVAIRDEYSG